MDQKGSVLPILLVLVITAGGVFAGFKFVNQKATPRKPPKPVLQADFAPTSKPLIQLPQIVQATNTPKTYKDDVLNFQMEYPADFEVTADSEETYFKISQTDHRKNFVGYVGYQPPVFVKGLMLKNSDMKITSQYDSIPLVLWVFDNPNKLTIDAWFDKYWYYPFVWGIFAQPGKGHIYPNTEATVSGQPAKSVIVSYQPGKPEFMYIGKGDKMFMFRIIKGSDEKVVTQILSSFKFTK